MSTACVTDDNGPKVAKNCVDKTELTFVYIGQNLRMWKPS